MKKEMIPPGTPCIDREKENVAALSSIAYLLRKMDNACPVGCFVYATLESDTLRLEWSFSLSGGAHRHCVLIPPNEYHDIDRILHYAGREMIANAKG